MGHIILGIIFLIVGTFLTLKHDWIFREFGRTEFAEKHLSYEGGSRLFYRLVGIVIIILGFLIIGGIHFAILNWIGRTLFSGFLAE